MGAFTRGRRSQGESNGRPWAIATPDENCRLCLALHKTESLVGARQDSHTHRSAGRVRGIVGMRIPGGGLDPDGNCVSVAGYTYAPRSWWSTLFTTDVGLLGPSLPMDAR